MMFCLQAAFKKRLGSAAAAFAAACFCVLLDMRGIMLARRL